MKKEVINNILENLSNIKKDINNICQITQSSSLTTSSMNLIKYMNMISSNLEKEVYNKGE